MRHKPTHTWAAFSLLVFTSIGLIVTPNAIAQERPLTAPDQKNLLPMPPATGLGSAGKMPGQTNKAKIMADVREYFARNNITVTIVPATQQTVEQYRADMIAIINALKATLVGYNLPGADRLDVSIASLQALTEEEMLKFKNVLDLTMIKTLILNQSQVLNRSIDLGKRERIQRQQAMVKSALAAGLYPGPFPDPNYSQLCPANPQLPEALFISGQIFNAAELAAAIAGVICSQAAAGFNAKLACFVTESILYAAQIQFSYVEFCDENTTGAWIEAIMNRGEYIKDQLEFSIANDNANKALLSTQIANMDVHLATVANNNTATLGAQAAAAQTLRVRQAIENNLGSDLTNVAAVGLFQLPASQGGYLEVARQLLIDTYNAQVAAAGAGVVVYNPSTELSLGATYTTQGKYREAYYQYRKGYRNVVKYP